MRITSEEIAKLADVSRSTVSRVINNYPNVPEATRVKVMDVIEKYGYHPNSSARVLAGKSNHTIALFIADYGRGEKRWRGMESPYFVRLIAELVSQCREYGYALSVSIVSGSPDYLRIEDMYLNREILGGIFIGFEYEMHNINRMIAKGFNMVVVDPGDGMAEGENVKGIYTENVKAGYIATSYLLGKGHRCILHIAGDDRKSSRDRIQGFCMAMKEANIDEKDIWIEEGEFGAGKAYEITKKALESPVTAIFAASDTMAVAAIRAIRDSGKKVPEDIAVAGCDYNEVFLAAGYELTTIELSIHGIATESVKAILGKGRSSIIYCKAIFKQGKTV